MAGSTEKKRFADAVADRFGKTMGPAPAAEPDGDEDGEGYDKDGEDGKVLAAAIKRGDGKAICEAVRRIASE